MDNHIEMIDRILAEHSTIVQDAGGACSDATAETARRMVNKSVLNNFIEIYPLILFLSTTTCT